MGTRTRVALYSHDTVGLGHARRSLKLAETLTAADASVDILLITGNPEAALLPRPERTDLLALPAIGKDSAGRYRPRMLGGPLADVLRLRSGVIASALREFAPHLLVVDKVAGGLGGELRPALEELSSIGLTRIVLGLREVLDRPETVRREWERSGTPELIARHYDEVWVYGDPAVFDPVVEYGWDGRLATTVRHLGYLGRPAVREGTPGPHAAGRPQDPYVLCQVGGGEDGLALAEAFTWTRLPDGFRGVLLTGPYLAPNRREQLRRIAGEGTTVLDFVDNPEEFVAGATAVVSMAGYNSTVELLATRTPALLVPRTRPRAEQLIRAQRLADGGHVDLMPPGVLTPARLADWLAEAVTRPDSVDRSGLDLGAGNRIPQLAFRLISESEDVA